MDTADVAENITNDDRHVSRIGLDLVTGCGLHSVKGAGVIHATGQTEVRRTPLDKLCEADCGGTEMYDRIDMFH